MKREYTWTLQLEEEKSDDTTLAQMVEIDIDDLEQAQKAIEVMGASAFRTVKKLYCERHGHEYVSMVPSTEELDKNLIVCRRCHDNSPKQGDTFTYVDDKSRVDTIE